MRNWLDVFMMLLMYSAGFTLIIYGILKGFGIINTPLMVLAIPYIVGGISIVGAVFYFAMMVNKIENNGRTLKGYERMKDDFTSVRDKQKMCLSGELKGSPYSE